MLLLFLAILIVALWCYKVINAHTYWTKRGVKQEGVVDILVDIFKLLVLRKFSIFDIVQASYTKFPGAVAYGAYRFGSPMVVVKDPDAIAKITIKDYNYFVDHGDFFGGEQDALWQRNLFALKGDKWRYMRATLSPSFTSIKIKAMFNLMSSCAQQFADHFDKKDEPIIILETRDAFRRYASDVIATCAFGIEVDSLKNPENRFFQMGQEITNFSGLKKLYTFFMLSTFPRISNLLGLRFISKETSSFFVDLIDETITARKKLGVSRPDLLQLLIDARKGGLKYEESQESSKEAGFATVEESDVGKATPESDQLSLVDMTAQALVFFFAGFDTVATTMSFISYEMALNPELQERLHAEIDETREKCDGKLTYTALSEMKYLDMVISESLRKWPIAVANDRLCVQTYHLDTPEGPIIIPKGTLIWLPVYGLYHDPKYFPDPQRFDPERFNDQNKSSITSRIYQPFGAGPRNCIGSRFALLEMKVLYFHLLSKFEFVIVEKTDVPIQLNKNGFQIHFQVNTKNGFWLGMKRRKV